MNRPIQNETNIQVDACVDVLVTGADASKNKTSKRRTKLSRKRFDALRRATRRVDQNLLSQIQSDQSLESPTDETTSDRIAERIRLNRYSLSSMLFSFIVHLSIFLVLAFLLSVASKPERKIGLEAQFSASLPVDPDAGPEETPDLVKIEVEKPPTDSELEMTADDAARDQVNEMANFTKESPSPTLNTDSSPTTSDTIANRGNLPTLPTGGGLQGRSATSRSKLAAARGGTIGSEAAVERGILWIVQHQRADGSWRLRHNVDQCNGQCRNQGRIESPTAATGLALMALLGAGYTHQAGPYQNEVRDGLTFLIGEMRKDGNLALGSGGKAGMYSQAIATIALGEAFAMTADPALAEPVEMAQKFICKAQNEYNYSWGYSPGQPGDITVTGWQIAALKSCKMAGVKIDPVVWRNAGVFIDSTTDTSGLYGYKIPPEAKQRGRKRDYNLPTTTAIGVLNKMYMGEPFDSHGIERASAYLFEQGISKSDIYFNYYATQVFRHRGGEQWKQWNPIVRDYLIDTQDQSSPHARGSWFFPDDHAKSGGRLYTTAMAVMTLEVYYRYLPLYREASLTDEEVPLQVEQQAGLKFN
jgi:hypothetical protein